MCCVPWLGRQRKEKKEVNRVGEIRRRNKCEDGDGNSRQVNPGREARASKGYHSADRNY